MNGKHFRCVADDKDFVYVRRSGGDRVAIDAVYSGTENARDLTIILTKKQVKEMRKHLKALIAELP